MSPVGTNILVADYVRDTGQILFDPDLPVQDVTARINIFALGYTRALNFFGRSANLRMAVPYTLGNLRGLLQGQPAQVYRSGLANPGAQLSINLYGAPAMDRQAFARYRQHTNIFASLSVIVPLGQYDAASLINIGTNRWAFKPQIALSQAIGKLYIDAYAGAWLYTANRRFLVNSVRAQEPLSLYQAHIAYAFRRRFWVGASAAYYRGGNTVLNGRVERNFESNAQYAAAVSVPLSDRQALLVRYGNTPIRLSGSKFYWLQIGYSYLWMGR